MSACPASIRWTAPELLAHPVTRETLAPPAVDRSELEGDMGSRKPGVKSGGASAVSIITPACDVFSFAMVMWELPMCQDPFEEISTEAEVCQSCLVFYFPTNGAVPVVDCFGLVVFGIDCVVCITVSQLFGCVLLTWVTVNVWFVTR